MGDYTRKLAGTLILRGLDARIVAINDQHLEAETLQEDQCEHATIPVLRLSSRLSWKKRIEAVKKFVAGFNPANISLQFVPFGFHLKGLPFAFAGRLKQLGLKGRWHIMFHELSVNKDESLKFRLWAYLQVQIIHSLIKQLKPSCISTNTAIYKYRLEDMGYPTNLLPLFSNISNKTSAGNFAFDQIVPAYLSQHRQDYIIGTLFGNFDFKSWNIRSLLDKFSYGFTRKRIVVVSVGKMSSGGTYWEQLKCDYPQVLFLRLGEQDAAFISYWLLHYADFGILTTLPELASKSGSFMALKEHGIPVVCKERSLLLKEYDVPLDDFLTEVHEDRSFELPQRREPVACLDAVTAAFIGQLELPARRALENHI